MERHIVYIPGLGDKNDGFRRLALLLWKSRKVAVTFVPMNWEARDESFDQKLERVKEATRAYPGHQTIIVGESAGGAVALTAFRNIDSSDVHVRTLCGMNFGADSVGSHIYRKNVAFRDAMDQVDLIVPTLTSDEKQRIKVIYSSADPTVRPKNTLIDGVEAYDLKTPGHLWPIINVLFFRFRIVTN